ncbi:cohesin domain-containing protein [Natronosalvus rutilus]|uniref:Cohesin domain-containing protein n=1 Tax=Natronosalvus rutilus TaxID=2953753 RepID=A0A9E7NB21_9EURY|nr:cohesin domain-containing protein [Natronosalvus rutilus]UTF53615.1 cohesin domain-containing protein [Natronosalvus rutilus]
MTGRRLLVATLALALVTSTVALAGFGVGTVTAGDAVATISPTPYEVEAQPGEEIEIDVIMRSQGAHGEGVTSYELIAQYHPDYLEVTDVEAGDWLEQGEESEISEEQVIANEAGTAILEQRRDPVAGGATGQARVATITIEVAADAPAAQTTLSFGNSEVYLEREFPLAVHDREVTISIDGGEEPHEPFDHPDPHDRDALEAMANESADDSDRSGTGDDTDSSDSSDDADENTSGSANESGSDEPREADDADSVPGFTAVSLLVALLALAGFRRVLDGER